MVMLIKENRQVLQVCVRILLAAPGRCHLRTSLAVLAHLDAVLRAIAPEPLPLNFSAEPLLHMLHHLAESEHFKLAASALTFLYNRLDALGDTASSAVQLAPFASPYLRCTGRASCAPFSSPCGHQSD